MAKAANWRRLTNERKATEDRWGETAGASHTRSVRKGNWRVYQEKLCQELLAAPELDDSGREFVLKERRFLEDNPRGRLSFKAERLLRAMESSVLARRLGLPPRPKPLPSLRLKGKARLHRPTERPSWMANPSLLPKKPPGRT